ncbi:MAG TPA: glycosyltransferase family 4 protein [Anaerolineales bacterium]|nr:glycosyltransferase family 4 protein [Anaerolineales bacterium]
MTYKVAIYCPDQHFYYDPASIEKNGAGGGLMARIRLAQALARLGHQPYIIANLTGSTVHKGVTYLPLIQADALKDVDILIMISSGGALSLEPALNLKIQARLREVWLQGTIPIQAVERLPHDFIVGASNFICDTVENEWGLTNPKLFAIYNGAVVRKSHWWNAASTRDSFALTYTSHPSKGLDASIAVLNLLRKRDDRFKLHVFGGDALWGGKDQSVSVPGVIYHGTQGQDKVLKALEEANISLHLQARLEPFGMVVTEAMIHGSIPVASPVGAYNEIVRDGYDGFLVPGEHTSTEVHQKTANLIYNLATTPEYAEYIRRQALNMPWTWDTQAKTWLQHWDWALEKKGMTFSPDHSHCLRCEGAWLLTADGYHCTQCGRYSRDGKA